MFMSILVTGGAGYIGAHTVLALLQSNCDVVVLDNFSNGSADSLKRLERIEARRPFIVEGDIRDRELLDRLFSTFPIETVLHFAGLKSVEESVREPLRYYDNNVRGSQVLLEAMALAGVRSIVFSSSATVYGQAGQMPISEDYPAATRINPYGRTKLTVENMLHDLARSDPRWRVAILRYFNPVGAHQSGLIGEDPSGVPNNLLPYVSQVAVGKLSELAVFGSDYPTPDGTGVRDYIHVMDLVEGHLCAIEALCSRSGVNVWNLGAGRGYSVLQIIRAFETASGRSVPYRIVPRREGDVAICYADTTKAERELNWRAKRALDEMMFDAWRWQSMNPNGYVNLASN
jgi:UDP-glucose 4-epimerase